MAKGKDDTIVIDGYLAEILHEIASIYHETAQEYVEDVLMREILNWIKEYA